MRCRAPHPPLSEGLPPTGDHPTPHPSTVRDECCSQAKRPPNGSRVATQGWLAICLPHCNGVLLAGQATTQWIARGHPGLAGHLLAPLQRGVARRRPRGWRRCRGERRRAGSWSADQRSAAVHWAPSGLEALSRGAAPCWFVECRPAQRGRPLGALGSLLTGAVEPAPRCLPESTMPWGCTETGFRPAC